MTGALDSAAPVDVPPNIADLLRFYFVHDQDGLNMALMACDNRISTLGSDGMGFTPAFGVAMTHSVGPFKPWNKEFVCHVLRRGAPPTAADVIGRVTLTAPWLRVQAAVADGEDAAHGGKGPVEVRGRA